MLISLYIYKSLMYAYKQCTFYVLLMRRELQKQRKRAREQLHRHGFDYKKRCRLMKHASSCVPRVEKYGDTVFGGLVRFERMHVYFINYTTYLMEALIACVQRDSHDHIHYIIKQCHNFRDPRSGSSFLRLPHLLKLTHLTAERRVMAIFYWAHVLGTARSLCKPFSYNCLKLSYKHWLL